MEATAQQKCQNFKNTPVIFRHPRGCQESTPWSIYAAFSHWKTIENGSRLYPETDDQSTKYLEDLTRNKRTSQQTFFVWLLMAISTMFGKSVFLGPGPGRSRRRWRTYSTWGRCRATLRTLRLLRTDPEQKFDAKGGKSGANKKGNVLSLQVHST